MQEQQITSESF